MKHLCYYLTLILLLSSVTGCAATQETQRDRPNQRDRSPRGERGTTARVGVDRQPRDTPPDVVLDVPNLQVDQITLEVDNLDAQLALNARVANLVQLNAGADVSINQVNLDIQGVAAEAHLLVDLDNVRLIIVRTLETLDNNPEIIRTLGETLQETVGTVGDVADQALRPGGVLSETVNTLGQTVTRTVDSAGNIVEQTLGQGGEVVSQRTLGSVTDLTDVVSETTNQAGQTVRRVRDESGRVIEYAQNNAGNVSNARVIGGGGLLSRTVNNTGQTVFRTVNSAGDIVERTLGQGGEVVSQRTLGSVTDLTDVVSETTNQAGETVRRVRDESGRMIEYTLDDAGDIANVRVTGRSRQTNSRR